MFFCNFRKIASFPGIIDDGEKDNFSWERAWRAGLLVKAPSFFHLHFLALSDVENSLSELQKVWRIAHNIKARRDLENDE